MEHAFCCLPVDDFIVLNIESVLGFSQPGSSCVLQLQINIIDFSLVAAAIQSRTCFVFEMFQSIRGSGELNRL